MQDKSVTTELQHPFDLIADGAKEDREKIEAGEPILAQNEKWLPGRDAEGNFSLIELGPVGSHRQPAPTTDYLINVMRFVSLNSPASRR